MLKTICFTGKLNKFTRDDARGLAQRAGFMISTQVSKNLGILVCADKNGITNRLRRARELGVTLWDEAEFLEHCGQAEVDRKAGEVAVRKSAPVTWEKICRKICEKAGLVLEIKKGFGYLNGREDYNRPVWHIAAYAHGHHWNSHPFRSAAESLNTAYEHLVRSLCGDITSMPYIYRRVHTEWMKELEQLGIPQFEKFDTPEELKMRLTISGFVVFTDED